MSDLVVKGFAFIDSGVHLGYLFFVQLQQIEKCTRLQIFPCAGSFLEVLLEGLGRQQRSDHGTHGGSLRKEECTPLPAEFGQAWSRVNVQFTGGI